MQMKYREGPCVQAALDDLIVRTDDFRSEERWPMYSAAAAELGSSSAMVGIVVALVVVVVGIPRNHILRHADTATATATASSGAADYAVVVVVRVPNGSGSCPI